MRTTRFIRRVLTALREGDVPVDPLVSPLRYDILIRRDFFDCIARHRALVARDLDAFVEHAARTPYAVWFHSVFLGVHPELADDAERAFHDRVRAAVELYESFGRRGFDPRFPIVLRRLPDGRLCAGDGCHRIALLMRTGHRVLRPWMYRVDPAQRDTPRDNTALLRPHLQVAEGTWARYLSRAS